MDLFKAWMADDDGAKTRKSIKAWSAKMMEDWRFIEQPPKADAEDRTEGMATAQMAAPTIVYENFNDQGLHREMSKLKCELKSLNEYVCTLAVKHNMLLEDTAYTQSPETLRDDTLCARHLCTRCRWLTPCAKNLRALRGAAP